MPRPKKHHDLDHQSLLSMALVGLEQKRQEFDVQIAAIKKALRVGVRSYQKSTATEREAEPTKVRRVLSPSARKRIVLAQKKRWAAVRAAATVAPKKGKGSKLSAAERARLSGGQAT